jgi:hypothetical protein
MINIARMSDGQSTEGKQLLFVLTVGVSVFMILYYRNQLKIGKMKIEEMKIARDEAKLDHL